MHHNLLSGGDSFEILGDEFNGKREAQAYFGAGGFAASGVQGQSPWSGGRSGGEAPLKPANFQRMRHTVLHKTDIKFGQLNLT